MSVHLSGCDVVLIGGDVIVTSIDGTQIILLLSIIHIQYSETNKKI